MQIQFGIEFWSIILIRAAVNVIPWLSHCCGVEHDTKCIFQRSHSEKMLVHTVHIHTHDYIYVHACGMCRLVNRNSTTRQISKWFTFSCLRSIRMTMMFILELDTQLSIKKNLGCQNSKNDWRERPTSDKYIWKMIHFRSHPPRFSSVFLKSAHYWPASQCEWLLWWQDNEILTEITQQNNPFF